MNQFQGRIPEHIMFESGLEANATSFAPLCAENKRSLKVKVIEASQHIACVKIGEDGMWGELKEAFQLLFPRHLQGQEKREVSIMLKT